MTRFVEGEDCAQLALLPASLEGPVWRAPSLEDYVGEDNPVRVVDIYIYVEDLDLAALAFAGARPKATGRPAYHPSMLLRIYTLRLPQPDPVEPPAGARGGAQP